MCRDLRTHHERYLECWRCADCDSLNVFISFEDSDRMMTVRCNSCNASQHFVRTTIPVGTRPATWKLSFCFGTTHDDKSAVELSHPNDPTDTYFARYVCRHTIWSPRTQEYMEQLEERYGHKEVSA